MQLDFIDGPLSKARFFGARSIAVSSGGRFIYVADKCNHRIRRIDRDLKLVSTIAGNGQANETDGPALQASIDPEDQMCFDRATLVPDSALFIGGLECVRRLKLSESAIDIIEYRIKPNCTELTWRALLRDLWYIVAEYFGEVAMLSTLRVLPKVFAMDSLPSGDLLVTSALTELIIVNPESGLQTEIAGIKYVQGNRDGNGEIARFDEISSIVTDDIDRCAYVSDCKDRYYVSSIRRVTLPSNYFLPMAVRLR